MSADGRSNRRTYTAAEKDAALHLVREVGVGETARRLGISPYTLVEWKMSTKALAYSRFVGRGRPVDAEERSRLLAQLVHEQELEQRFEGRRTYRHDVGWAGASPIEGLDVALTRSGVVHRHLLEWLDPTFDEVAERLAA